MKVKATELFEMKNLYPLELDHIPQKGEIFEVSEERFKVLSGNNQLGGTFVKDITKKKKNKIVKENNKIAVIIPNCNYEKHIKKCLDSILKQTYKNYEIIFIDDMSTDNSLEVAKKMLKPPHKVIKLKQKRYNGGARNEAYLHISDDVDYIYYIDSDDWLKDKHVFKKINDKLKYAPDVLFVGMAEYSNGIYTTTVTPDYDDKYDAFNGWSGSCGKVIKKELATRQECLYNEGTLKEDKNQHCRICIYMDSFDILPEPIYVWNKDNTESITTKRTNIVWKTSTIRHYADTKQLYLEQQGKDLIIEELLKRRLELTKDELLNGGDRQF